MKEREVLSVLPAAVRRAVGGEGTLSALGIQEIRMRVSRPLLFTDGRSEWGLRPEGGLVPLAGADRHALWSVSREQIEETVQYVSRYSAYAYAREMSQGFITIQGGHRVGLCGKAVLEEGRIRTFQYITCVNIRIARERIGCGAGVFPWLVRDGRLCHTLILSPPGQGKTTLLRDLVRQASDGGPALRGCQVSLIDERSELAACCRGVPQNDVGMRTDVLDGCSKAEGMMLVLRSMNPAVIAVDEIGSREDVEAVSRAAASGSVILATVHGESLEGLRRKAVFAELFAQRLFQRYVFVSRGESGVEYRVCDEEFREIEGGA